MKITVESKEEHLLVTQLCDIALRADGIKNLQGVNLILNSIKEAYDGLTRNSGSPKAETEKGSPDTKEPDKNTGTGTKRPKK